MTRTARRCCDALTFMALGALAILGCQNFRGSPRTWTPPSAELIRADLTEPQTRPDEPPPAAATAHREPVREIATETDAVRGERLRQQLEPLARQLASVAAKPGLSFTVEVLKSARPRIYHCDDGQVFVSTGLLDHLESADELAAVLALEMAEALIEQQAPTASRPELPATGPDDEFRERALRDKIARSTSPASQRQMEWLAGQLLERAGLHAAEVPTAVARLRALESGESPALDVTRPPGRTTF
jgi:hypothetical protein